MSLRPINNLIFNQLKHKIYIIIDIHYNTYVIYFSQYSKLIIIRYSIFLLWIISDKLLSVDNKFTYSHE